MVGSVGVKSRAISTGKWNPVCSSRILSTPQVHIIAAHNRTLVKLNKLVVAHKTYDPFIHHHLPDIDRGSEFHAFKGAAAGEGDIHLAGGEDLVGEVEN